MDVDRLHPWVEFVYILEHAPSCSLRLEAEHSAFVLLAPTREVPVEQGRRPGAVIRVAVAALVFDVAQRGTNDGVPAEEDRTVGAKLVEARPEEFGRRIGNDAPVPPPVSASERLEAQARNRGSLQPGDRPLDGGDDLRRRLLD